MQPYYSGWYMPSAIPISYQQHPHPHASRGLPVFPRNPLILSQSLGTPTQAYEASIHPLHQTLSSHFTTDSIEKNKQEVEEDEGEKWNAEENAKRESVSELRQSMRISGGANGEEKNEYICEKGRAQVEMREEWTSGRLYARSTRRESLLRGRS